ncbi:uncharacterized protein LOC111630450 [Centruroides sculpturatus]|uniref:uncharacterized protein LOC111630450 n=1 Tax=Centruroides sculpturatus TaxID=218467 RepID=UPI000C6E043B|nr:uncharacterized protein LOC111630450 [Centruroides sculpturatus]
MDNNNSTGRGRISWPYFHLLNDILGNTGTIVPVSELVNSSDNRKQNNENETEEQNKTISEISLSNNKTEEKIKKKRKIPEWAQEILSNQRKKAKADAEHQDRMAKLLQENINENRKRTDILTKLVNILEEKLK